MCLLFGFDLLFDFVVGVVRWLLLVGFAYFILRLCWFVLGLYWFVWLCCMGLL